MRAPIRTSLIGEVVVPVRHTLLMMNLRINLFIQNTIRTFEFCFVECCDKFKLVKEFLVAEKKPQ